MNPSITKTELSDMFKRADKEFLMSEKEYKKWQDLPEKLTIYRGVTEYNGKNIRALSWTTNYDTAKWFAGRYDKKGKVKSHIDKVFTENITADNEEEMSLQIRISELDAEIKSMISSVSADTIDDFDEEKAQSLMSEKNELQNKLEEFYGNKTRKEAVQSRLQDVYAIMDGLKNHQIVYNDELIRQIIEVVIVESKEKIKIIFKGGLTVEEDL